MNYIRTTLKSISQNYQISKKKIFFWQTSRKVSFSYALSQENLYESFFESFVEINSYLSFIFISRRRKSWYWTWTVTYNFLSKSFLYFLKKFWHLFCFVIIFACFIINISVVILFATYIYFILRVINIYFLIYFRF